MNLFRKFFESPKLFNGISWGLTAVIVLSLLGFTLGRIFPVSAQLPVEPTPTEAAGAASLPGTSGLANNGQAIVRYVTLKTQMDQAVNYRVQEYTVKRGDSVFAIADAFKIKAETVFWANYELFDGSPDSLKPGQVINIPPVDGVYYEWVEGDTIESVAETFELDPEVILNWPGNEIDLTDPVIPVGTFVMLPGAEKNDQPLFIQTYTVASSGSSTSGGGCGISIASRGFFGWPTNAHTLSGYNFGEAGHRGIDISATEGTSIFASDNGVVTMAAVGWNYGYGNVIQIDHGNGFVTLYAHLSIINVNVCDIVTAGQVIGSAGNTGNSFGAHLHFEVRSGGVAINPWNVLP